MISTHRHTRLKDGNDKTSRSNDVWWLDKKLFLITNFTNCHFWCSAILLPIHFNYMQKSSVNNLLNVCYCGPQKIKASQIWVRKWWPNFPFWMNALNEHQCTCWWFSSTTHASTCKANTINICETEKNVIDCVINTHTHETSGVHGVPLANSVKGKIL